MERQIIESLKRLYDNGVVDEKKINELCDKKKITKNEKDYIFNAH